MKCFLKYKTKKILEFDLEARTGTHVVKATSVIDRTLLPEPLKRIKEQHMPAELMKWLARRAIPNNRYDIDKMLLKLYGLRYCDFGRLYSHQHIAALLSHYASWFDNYIVDVEHPKALFFGYEDFRFSTLWFLEPYNDESISRSQPQGATDKYVENIKKDAPRDFTTYALTIQSELPSWWGQENDRVMLYQRLQLEKHFNYAHALIDVLRKYYPPIKIFMNNDIVSTDFTAYVGMDCSWIIDFLDDEYMKDNKSWNEEVIEKCPDAEDTVKILKKIYEKLKGEDIIINPCNMGIGMLNGENFPVILL